MKENKPTHAKVSSGFRLFAGFLMAFLVLSACASPTEVSPTQLSSSDQVATVVAATMQALPSNTPEPAAESSNCPQPAEGTQLMTNEHYGYCLLVPAGYSPLDSNPYDLCLAPENFVFWETPCPISISVLDASGRTLSQLAEGRITQIGFVIEPSTLTVAGVEALSFDNMPGQVSTREVLFVHNDRLHTLGFILPDSADPSGVETFERIYETIISSFTFVTAVPFQAETETSRGTAVVVYIKDGDILVWDEATGKTQTIFDSGDVTRVELSDDGQRVAFVRGVSLLWVVGRDGQNARELDTGQAMVWIPNSHRLLYSRFSAVYDWFYQGLTLLDVDTGARAGLASDEEFVSFMPSPDGKYIGIVFSSGPAIVNVEKSLLGMVDLIRPAGGVPVPWGQQDFSPAWTQDSSAFLVKGSVVRTRGLEPLFTILRVPVNGAPAEALITLRGDHEQFAPDGSVIALVRRTNPLGAPTRVILPMPEGLGPLAVLRDPFAPLSLSWSPDSTAYVLGRDEIFPLCPDAAQVIETCEPSIHFGAAMESFEWLDRDRFLYVTHVPRRLMLGSLKGSAAVIAEDPQDPSTWAHWRSRGSFDGVASTCVDNSEFVSDVTVPDGTHFAPGTFFIKTWRLRNTGACTWDDTYRFTFLTGDRLSGPRSAPLDQPVEPGEEMEVSIGIVAPEAAGTYQGQWQMFAPDGTPFGSSVYVAIVIP